MATVTRFEYLEIWKISKSLAIKIYSFTKKEGFCKEYKLKEQIKASVGSIMDNIAEGFERDGRKEFKNFLSIAKGSCGEVKSQLHRSFDWQLISESEFKETYIEADILAKKISTFIRYLNNTSINGSKFRKNPAPET